MADQLSPAVRRALAYVHLTGRIPIGIRNSTWGAVYERCNKHPYKVKPEFVADVERHPLCRAAAELISRGFQTTSWANAGRTANSVAFMNSDGVEAHAYQSGYWSIDFGRGGRGNVTRMSAMETGNV